MGALSRAERASEKDEGCLNASNPSTRLSPLPAVAAVESRQSGRRWQTSSLPAASQRRRLATMVRQASSCHRRHGSRVWTWGIARCHFTVDPARTQGSRSVGGKPPGAQHPAGAREPRQKWTWRWRLLTPMQEPSKQPNQAASVAPLALPIKSSQCMMQLVDESALRRSDLSRAPTGREVAIDRR